MSDSAVFEPHRTAVLALDFLTMILEHYASDTYASGDRAAKVCEVARSTDCLVGHVTPTMMVDRTKPLEDSVEFYPPLRPAPGEARFTKDGIGAFASTGLERWLRQNGRDTLVIMGVATSGTVLSTVRWAFDLGYRLIVVTDACSDMDPTVHELLTRQVDSESWVGLWKMAELVTTEQIIARLGA